MSVAVCMQLEKSRQELEMVRSENAQLKQFISQVRLVRICELYVIRPHRRRSWMRPIATNVVLFQYLLIVRSAKRINRSRCRLVIIIIIIVKRRLISRRNMPGDITRVRLGGIGGSSPSCLEGPSPLFRVRGEAR